MAQKENKSVTVLSYAVDQQSISRVLKAADRVEKAIEDSVGSLGDYAPATKLATKGLEASFDSLDASLEQHGRLVDEISDLYDALDRQQSQLADNAFVDALRAETNAAERAADAYDDLASSKQGAANVRGQGGGNALDVADNAASKASQILSGLGAGESANSVGLIGDALSAVSAFGPAAGVVTVALGAATAAVGVYTQALQKSTERAQTYGEAVQAAFEAGTSAQIDALIQQQQNDLQILEATRGQLEQKSSEAREQLAITLDDASENLTNFLNNLAGTPTDYSRYDLETSLEGYQAELGNVNAQIEIGQVRLQAYNDILGQNAIVVGDNAAALAEESAARDAAVRREMEINAELDSMTSEQRRAKIQELIKEREALQLAASYTGLSADYQNELAASLADVNERINIFASDVWTTADALDASAKAAEELEAVQARYSDATDDVFQATTAVVEAYEKAAKATEEYNQAIAEHEANLAQIEADRIAKRDELRTKAAEDEIKAEEATAKKLRDIQRKADLSMLSAIANRDALAYKQAKDAAEEQIKTETDSLAERKKELRDALEEQLDDQDKAARQAVAREEQRWNEERAVRIRANQLALVDVQNAENAQRAARQNANVAALALMEMRATGEANVYSSMASTAAFYLDYMEAKNAAVWAAMAAAIGGSGIGGGAGGAQPTPFADGGLVTSSGLAMLHAPEVIVPLRPAGKAPLSSMTTIHQNAGGVTLNIAGSTPGQIRREVDRQLDGYFRKAGFYD